MKFYSCFFSSLRIKFALCWRAKSSPFSLFFLSALWSGVRLFLFFKFMPSLPNISQRSEQRPLASR